MARWHWERRRGVVRLTYPNGRVVQIVRGVSVLEASRMAGIPHASVCGGRGRCSTCRIRVDGPKEAILPPAAEERDYFNKCVANRGNMDDDAPKQAK